MTPVDRILENYPALVWRSWLLCLSYGRQLWISPDRKHLAIWVGVVDEINATPRGHLIQCRLMAEVSWGGHYNCTMRAVRGQSLFGRLLFWRPKCNILNVCVTPWRHVQFRLDRWKPNTAPKPFVEGEHNEKAC